MNHFDTFLTKLKYPPMQYTAPLEELDDIDSLLKNLESKVSSPVQENIYTPSLPEVSK